MYEIVFTILFIVLMGVSVGLVVSGLIGLSTAKAGKVSKPCPRYVFYNRSDNGKISVDGRSVDVSKMVHLAVCGNSMKDYDIFDGQEIYAHRISSEAEKRNIQDHPVLIFRITNAKIYDSQYKLRKFVDYGNLENSDKDWDHVYEKNAQRIKLNREDFVQKCLIKSKRLKRLQMGDEVALSETFDEDANVYDYSLHPVDTIYATVEYTV